MAETSSDVEDLPVAQRELIRKFVDTAYALYSQTQHLLHGNSGNSGTFQQKRVQVSKALKCARPPYAGPRCRLSTKIPPTTSAVPNRWSGVRRSPNQKSAPRLTPGALRPIEMG
jgi:hypothetical protein